MRVPAWTLAISEHSVGDWVYVLTDQPHPLNPSQNDVRVVHYLTPVTQVGHDDIGIPLVNLRL